MNRRLFIPTRALDCAQFAETDLEPASGSAVRSARDRRSPTVAFAVTLAVVLALLPHAPAAADPHESARLEMHVGMPSANQGQETPDPARLAHPTVAEQLELTEDQINQVQTLLNQRVNELANAPAGEHAAIRKRIDDALLALLTDVQRTKFIEQAESQPLRFNFREQKWDEVLAWFADQAQLSLIMDQIPPGTFSYSGNRSFSPSEGLDLLNSVLMTKGFTLVHRNKMLIVLPLGDQIPIEVVPRVTLEELADRGRFEFVSVMFPLGSRPIDAVVNEVKPYLSNYGKAVPLPQSHQLLVMETAGKMQAINVLIASVPEPKPPAPQPQPEKPPAPVFASYPLGLLDPQSTLETLSQIMGTERITVDPQTKLLTAFVPPGQQAAIKAALDELTAKAVAQGPPVAKSYEFETQNSEALIQQLASIAPDAKIGYDAERMRITVFGTELDQQRVGQALEAMGATTTVEPGEANVQVYEIPGTSDITELSALLQEMAPDARVVANAATRRIAFYGKPADIELAGRMLAQWNQQTDASKKILRVHVISRRLPSDVLTNLTTLVPDSQLIASSDPRRVAIIATPDDQQLIASTLEEMVAGLPEPAPRRLQLYELPPDVRKRWQLLQESLTSQLEEAQLVEDQAEEELLVLATDEQHQLIEATLTQIKTALAGEEEQTELVAYPLTVQDIQTVQDLLKEKFPKARMLFHAPDRSLLVWTSDTKQQEVAVALESLQAALPAEVKPRLEAYFSDTFKASELQSWITQAEPTVTATVDTPRNRVIVSATDEQHAKLKELLTSLQRDLPSGVKRGLKMIEIEPDDVSTAQTLLATIAPEASVTWNAEREQLMIVASADDHEKIAQAIQELKQSRPEDEAEQFQHFPLDRATVARFETIRAQVEADYPDARIVSDASEGGLLVWASAEAMTRIGELLNQLSEVKPTGEKPVLIAYRLQHADPEVVSTMVSNLIPDANVSVDVKAKQVVVVASLVDQVRVKSMVEQMDGEPAADTELELRAYDVGDLSVEQVSTMLTQLRDDIEFNADSRSGKLMASATAKDHEWIQDTLRKLTSTNGNETHVTKAYDAKGANLATLPSVLTQLTPEAIITTDPSTSRVLVWGSPDDQARIQDAIEQLTQPSELTNELSMHPVEPTRASYTLSVLQTMFPGKSISLDPNQKRILVWADEQDRKAVASAIEQIRTDPADGQEGLIRVYSLKRVDPAIFAETLTTRVPKARVVAGSGTTRFVVSGNADTHTDVATLIRELESAYAETTEQDLRAHNVRKDLKTEAQTAITQEFPTVRFVSTATPDQLLIWASETVHERVDALIASLGETITEPEPRQTAVLMLDKLDATSAQQVLVAQLPTLEFLPTEATDRLIAWGEPKLLEDAKAALEQLKKVQPEEPSRKVDVFPIDKKKSDAQTIVTALDPSVTKRVALQVNAATNSIIVTGLPTEVDKVGAAIQSLVEGLPDPDTLETRVYRFKVGDPQAAYVALRAMYPLATMGVDTSAKSLAITAAPDDHEEIDTIIQQLDQSNQREGTSTRTYRLTQGSPTVLASVLTTLLPDATILADTSAQVVVATATDDEHTTIRTVVDQYGAIDDENQSIKVYGLKRSTPTAVASVVGDALPNVNVIPDTAAGAIIVTANEEQHARVADLVTQMDQLQERTGTSTKTYRLVQGSPQIVAGVLKELLPEATILGDTAAEVVVATATEEEHATIKSVVEQYGAIDDASQTIQVYGLKRANPDSVSSVITEAMPNARVVADDETRALVVTANEKDHQRIADLVQKMDSLNQREGTSTHSYRVVRGDPRALASVLETLIPEATIIADRLADVVVATATEEEHARIRSVVDEYGSIDDASQSIQVYGLKRADPDSVSSAIEESMPNATVVADDDSRALIVTANEKDHQRIGELVQKMDELNQREGTMTRTYRLTQGDPRVLSSVLEELLPDATILGDRTADVLVATATAEEHETIKAVVEQYGAIDDESQSIKVYGLKRADPDSVESAVSEAMPATTVVADDASGAIIVTANDKEHQRIATLVEQMDQLNQREPMLEVYTIQHGDAESIYQSVSQAFPRSRSTGVSFDEQSQLVLVVATPDDQAVAKKIIEQLDQPLKDADRRRLKVFSLVGSDGESVSEALESMFLDERPEVEVRYDTGLQQMVVVGNQRQLQLAEETIEQFRMPERKLEIFTLQRNEPSAASRAINALFTDEPFSTRPRVDQDLNNQQLFVRATAEQLDEIRGLLKQLGEPVEDASLNTGRIRTFPSNASFERALKEVESVWPRLRSNKIEVLRVDQAGESEAEDESKSRSQTPSPSADDQSLFTPREDRFQFVSTSRPALSQESTSSPANANRSPAANDQRSAVQADAGQTDQDDQEPAPIVVIPGASRTTVASEDIAALDQFVRLLQTVMERGNADAVVGNLSIYLLENAGAGQVERLLNDLFERVGDTPGSGFGSLAIVADERINGLIVFGNRTDRRLIDELIEVLDSDELVDSIISSVPRIVPVRNTQASRLIGILETVYRSQLNSSGGGRRLRIPEGISSEVATVLQQINAAADSPLLTIGVDEITNSMVIRAPVELADEVESFVETLDKQAEVDRARSIKIIPLQRTKSSQIEQVLERMMQIQ